MEGTRARTVEACQGASAAHRAGVGRLLAPPAKGKAAQARPQLLHLGAHRLGGLRNLRGTRGAHHRRTASTREAQTRSESRCAAAAHPLILHHRLGGLLDASACLGKGLRSKCPAQPVGHPTSPTGRQAAPWCRAARPPRTAAVFCATLESLMWSTVVLAVALIFSRESSSVTPADTDVAAWPSTLPVRSATCAVPVATLSAVRCLSTSPSPIANSSCTSNTACLQSTLTFSSCAHGGRWAKARAVGETPSRPARLGRGAPPAGARRTSHFCSSSGSLVSQSEVLAAPEDGTICEGVRFRRGKVEEGPARASRVAGPCAALAPIRRTPRTHLSALELEGHLFVGDEVLRRARTARGGGSGGDGSVGGCRRARGQRAALSNHARSPRTWSRMHPNGTWGRARGGGHAFERPITPGASDALAAPGLLLLPPPHLCADALKGVHRQVERHGQPWACPPARGGWSARSRGCVPGPHTHAGGGGEVMRVESATKLAVLRR